MKAFERLLDIIKTLRSEDGCPWDREQTLHSLDKLFLEECYELSEAVGQNNPKDIREELGDSFFMLLLMGYVAEQEQICSLEDIFDDASEKLISRHPHVFHKKQSLASDEVIRNWEELKKAEKKERSSIFDGIPASLPDMMRFAKLMRKLNSHHCDIGEYKEESTSPKARLKNFLIEMTQENQDIVSLLKEINHEIETSARKKGL